jgi:selenium donor protein
LAAVRLPFDARVLVGTDTSDDAGVVRVSDDLAVVQTVDFFPPMVDDPRWFGRVGAANSISDVYAMGGTPLCAVSLFALPPELPAWAGAEILNGAVEKLGEAGAALVGGHTVNDKELKFGLCVIGTIRPDQVVTNAGAKVGDVLVLTKPVGSGFLCTALKRGVLSEAEELRVMEVMASLNRDAAAAMVEVGVSAATDVTGFGILGHGIGMADAAGVTFRVRAGDVPWIEGLERHVSPQNTCGGLKKNQGYGETRVAWRGGTEDQRAVIADPQTSGGMLISVPADRLPTLLAALERRGVSTRAVIGEVVARGEHAMEVV